MAKLISQSPDVLYVGPVPPDAMPGGASFPALHEAVTSESATDSATRLQQQSTNSTNAPQYIFRKARGTVLTPVTVNNADLLFVLGAACFNNGTWYTGALIQGRAEAAPVAGQQVAQNLEFLTAPTNGNLTLRLIIASAGNVGIGGFATGAVPSGLLHVQTVNAGASPEVLIGRSSTDATGPQLTFQKSRGTFAAPTDPVSQDNLFLIQGNARNLGNYVNSASIGSYLQSGSEITPHSSTLEFVNTDANGVIGLRMIIVEGGNTGIGPFNRTTVKPAQLLHIASNSDGEFIVQTSSGDTNTALMNFRKSRGTVAAPTNIVNADYMGTLNAYGYSGATGWWSTASIRFKVSAAVVDNQRPASQIEFYTNAVNAAAVLYLSLSSAGVFNSVGDVTVASTKFTIASATGIATSTASGGGNLSGLQVNAVSPSLGLMATGQAANAKQWDVLVSGLTLSIRVVNDANNAAANVLVATRGTTTITDVSIGNATDNPTFNVLGTGVALFSGEVRLSSGNTVNASVLSTVTNKIKMVVGGSTYYLLASTSNG